MKRQLLRRAKRTLNRLLGVQEKTDGNPRWDPIWPRIPVLDGFTAVGKREDYFIHDGYQPRLEPQFFDDTPLKDEWQKEVYQFAREVAERFGIRKVLDIGCGSGYKLMRYFADVETMGVDLEPTVSFLRKKYPDRRWEVCDLTRPPKFHPDLVICADVIEHLPNPEELIRYIQLSRPELVVISTPERNLLMHGRHNGPPKNPAHVREWSLAEFRAYMDSEFEVLAHFISNGAQATQCVLAKLRTAGSGRQGEQALK